jgi:hypothetical protein
VDLMAGANTPAGRGGFHPAYHPAGNDDALRLALEDLRAGRWMAMRDLLAVTGSDWGLRTSRSQVLAAAASKSDVVTAWRAEEPLSADALLMQARVAVQRALLAQRSGHRDAHRVAQQARDLCQEASRHLPEDPVPWVGLLALAQLDVRQTRPEHRMPPPEQLLPDGPWGLMREVYNRDPYNREAWHRMYQVMQARGANPVDYVRWVASWAPKGSALLALPLYAHVEAYRARREDGAEGGLLAYWISPRVTYYTSRALHEWFYASTPSGRSVLDLNHLAHALWAGGFDEGASVFEAIGTFVTPTPWKDVADDPRWWEDDFVRARRHYLGDSGESAGDGRGGGEANGAAAPEPPR